jgi:hypothetical protein
MKYSRTASLGLKLEKQKLPIEMTLIDKCQNWGQSEV